MGDGGEWRIQLLGELRAGRGDQVVTRFRTRKTGELLAYLAYHRQRTHPRELLIDLLWPECDPDAGRHNLSVALSWLRGELGLPDVLGDVVFVADRYTVGLNPAWVTTDVADFETALQAAAEQREDASRAALLARAVELYRGDLLPGYYEDWIFPEQQRLEELFFHALRQLITLYEQAGDGDRAIPYALRAVSADPLREEARRELMRLYAAAGQPAAALRQFHELERLLKEELGETPSDATRALADEIGRSGVQGATGVQAFGRSGVQADPDDLRPSVDAHPVGPERLNARTRERPLTPAAPLEPIGGAVPLTSRFYVVRPDDAEFHAAIARRDSIVLVKGARQVGKTSLLARGLEQARRAGARVVFTDLQMFNAAHLESAETLLLALAEAIAEQLDLEVGPAEVWSARRGANPNFRRYLRREVMGAAEAPVVWGLDEVDRLFERPFASEIFGLFRSWHNERALDPAGPLANLTLAIAYATEAHLFITDGNQSPFNVGTRVPLEDFTQEQVADLNERYGSPLKGVEELARYYDLVGGHPYLVQRGQHEMASHRTPLKLLETRADHSEGIFGEHLRRLVAVLGRSPELCAVMRGVLQGQPCPTPESFYRLRSAGVIAGDSAADARPRCRLYAQYLGQHLP
jgi:DNA-binding SARP family transcriptional activator